MLPSVPGGMSSLGFPATVTRPGFDGCLNCRWLPRVTTKRHPSDSNILIASRTFIKPPYRTCGPEPRSNQESYCHIPIQGEGAQLVRRLYFTLHRRSYPRSAGDNPSSGQSSSVLYRRQVESSAEVRARELSQRGRRGECRRNHQKKEVRVCPSLLNFARRD
jgi:hypothetical protein